MSIVSLFGKGFIGSHFVKQFPSDVFVEERDSRVSEFPDILYMISTVHNYHVLEEGFGIFEDLSTNLIHFMEVLSESRKRHGSELVFNLISTWFVFGNNPDIPAKEDSPCNPKGFYSITARAREQLLISYCETFKIKYKIMRLGNVIGPGDEKASLKKNALQYFCKELANGRPITRYKRASVRDYIDVRDCVRAIRLVMDKGEPNQIYNIANGRGLNVKDLIDHAWVTSGFKSKISEIDVPDFHKTVQTPVIYMDNSKIRALGYIQEHDIENTVAELVHRYEQEEK